jgi:hypothetical protein
VARDGALEGLFLKGIDGWDESHPLIPFIFWAVIAFIKGTLEIGE